LKKYFFSKLPVLLTALILFNVIAFVFIRPFIISFLANQQEHPFFLSIINTAYPRFSVEVKRFSSEFFLGKFNQIIIRLNLIAITIIIGKYLWHKSVVKNYLLDRFKQLGHCSNSQIRILSTLFYIATFYYTYDWYLDLLKLSEVGKLYKPVVFLAPFFSLFPNKLIIHAIGLSYYLFLAICLITKRRVFSIFVAILFLIQLGLLQSFEKIDHTFASFTYAILLMPLLLSKKDELESLGFAGIRLSIGLCYFFSAIEKILTGGAAWFSGLSLKFYVSTKSEVFSYFTENLLLLQFASLFIILFQFFFIFAILLEKGKMVFIFTGIIFHFLTVLILNVGAYDTPWIFMYLFLLDTNTFTWRKKVFGKRLPDIFFAKR